MSHAAHTFQKYYSIVQAMIEKSVLVVIQCRFSSTRLPGKALYPIGNIPILTFLIRRLNENLPSEEYQIVLATTENIEDDPIAAWGIHEHVDVVRGPVDDVLGRYVKCLKQFPSNFIVRVTADNPFTCPDILKMCTNLIKDSDLDYVISDGSPYGTGVDVFTSNLILHLENNISETSEREHINDHILNNPLKFKIKIMQVSENIFCPDLRMTVDTMDDWKSITGLVDPNEPNPWNLPLGEAISRIRAKSDSL